ncbi:MAG: type I methionyl aminopeptidase [Dehalococcoidia bacterium]
MDDRASGRLETASTSAPPSSEGITLKSPQELECVWSAGRIVAQLLVRLQEAVRPGIHTRELDHLAAVMLRDAGAQATFKGYRGFPAHICVSLNQEVVHGIPGERALREGDIVKIDAGATVDGLIADAAITIPVGQITPEAQELIEVTRKALDVGVQAAVAGARVGDIGAAIQRFVEPRGYSVVRQYVGHGVGRSLHEEPQIPNYGEPGRGPLLRPGMVIAIEPMVNMGGWQTRVLDDDWTVVTADGSLSAHFEHTIAITAEGPQVLTALENHPAEGRQRS